MLHTLIALFFIALIITNAAAPAKAQEPSFNRLQANWSGDGHTQELKYLRQALSDMYAPGDPVTANQLERPEFTRLSKYPFLQAAYARVPQSKKYQESITSISLPGVTQYFSPLGASILNNLGAPQLPIPNIWFKPSIINTLFPPLEYNNFPFLYGGPPSDFVALLADLKTSYRTGEKLLDEPLVSHQARVIGFTQGLVEGTGEAARQSTQATIEEILRGNLANGSSPNNSVIEKIFQSYYIPLAILLVLPGAVLTQTQLTTSIFAPANSQKAQTPFDGMLRAFVAIFLIASVPLIMSYVRDISSSLSVSVEPYCDNDAISDWIGEQLSKVQAGAGTPGVDMKMTDAEAFTGALKNGLSFSLILGIDILTMFQKAIFDYLFLVGPVACAFYAYPETSTKFFRKALQSWLTALCQLTLWKFLWLAVLACMTARLQWVQGQPTTPAWESMMCVAFLVMLAVVPAACLSFSPGDYIDRLRAKAKSLNLITDGTNAQI